MPSSRNDLHVREIFTNVSLPMNRGPDSAANGYGFPSSHSQYMGYFASFLMMHLYFRHKFASTGYRILDQTWRVILYTALAAWALIVAYSRCVTAANISLRVHILISSRPHKILPPISQHCPDSVGFRYRRVARRIVLCGLRAYTQTTAQLFVRDAQIVSRAKPDFDLVADTRWLGCLGRWWAGGGMVAVAGRVGSAPNIE